MQRQKRRREGLESQGEVEAWVRGRGRGSVGGRRVVAEKRAARGFAARSPLSHTRPVGLPLAKNLSAAFIGAAGPLPIGYFDP